VSRARGVDDLRVLFGTTTKSGKESK
jgi:hypothetical protein